MGAVAERPEPRLTAATKRDRIAAVVECLSLVIENANRTADKQRSIAVRRYEDVSLGFHLALASREATAEIKRSIAHDPWPTSGGVQSAFIESGGVRPRRTSS